MISSLYHIERKTDISVTWHIECSCILSPFLMMKAWRWPRSDKTCCPSNVICKKYIRWKLRWWY